MEFLRLCKEALPDAVYCTLCTLLIAYKVQIVSESDADKCLTYILQPFPNILKEYNNCMIQYVNPSDFISNYMQT